jgi:transcriptional regulator with PAS, ATPase and Fis domain
VLAPDDLCELGHTFLRVNPSAPAPPDWPIDLDSANALGGARTLHPALDEQLRALAKVAASDVPVLILGDSGTGKELLARRVHSDSGRGGEFVAVNCGGIPSALVESSFFGHVKGAFSGAMRHEPGLVRAAHGGTLFLDEIGDLPKAAQAALLRVLQEHEVVPVGATRPVSVDVRIVAATHQPLEAMVERGDFRADVFSRIAGFTIRCPSLRELRDDFGVLVASLLLKIAPERAHSFVLAPDAGRSLLVYDWPLNIRELEQCFATCVALAHDGRIERSYLPQRVRSGEEVAKVPSVPAAGLSAHDERIRLELLTALSRHRGNLAEVARTMGKARMQIHRWCRRFGVDPNVYRE